MLRSLLTVSGFTLMSRVLGVIRDIFLASYIGTGVVSDAFFAAFRFPNMFRRIFGEGAFNSAFVPLFGKRMVEDGRFAAMKFANNAFSVLFLVLGALTIVLIPLMGWVMLVVVPGFKAGYESPAAAEAQHFRVPLNGARAVYFQVDGDAKKVDLKNLTLVERGSPPAEEIVQEIFGGLTPAKGKKVALTTALDAGLERAKEVPQGRDKEAVKKEIFAQGEWQINSEGLLRVPLPEKHPYAVLEGDWSGGKDNNLRVFANDPGAFELATKLSQITFIYLLCMALVAHLSGVLNTLKKFAAPAFSPVLLNIIFLISLYFFVRGSTNQGEILAWSVAVAGFAQLGLLWWTCRRAGLPVGLTVPKFTPEMKKFFILMGPGILAAGIQQINLLIGGIIASFQQGAISYLYYSDRIYQLPLGMIGIAFGVVLLPEITRLLKKDDAAGASRTMMRGLEMSMLITLPATIALMIIPEQIIAVLFQHGDFTANDSHQTGLALAAFAIGLPGYVLIKVLQPGYFAREDTKNPMFMAGATVLVNIVLSIILFIFHGHVGIALATSIAAWVNVTLLWLGLKKHLNVTKETLTRFRGILIACVAMAVLLYFGKQALLPWFATAGFQRIAALILLVGLGVTSYAIAALALKATSLSELKAGFKRS